MTDSIAIVLGLAVGDTFTVHGRTYTKRAYPAIGHADVADGSEKLIFCVWNSQKRASHITIRPNDKVEVLP